MALAVVFENNSWTTLKTLWVSLQPSCIVPKSKNNLYFKFTSQRKQTLVTFLDVVLAAERRGFLCQTARLIKLATSIEK